MPQTKIILQCNQCKHHNYVTSKNRQNVTDKLKLNKFCPTCGTPREEEEPSKKTSGRKARKPKEDDEPNRAKTHCPDCDEEVTPNKRGRCPECAKELDVL